MAATETRSMKSELKLLNLICILIALGFIALVILNALFSPQLLTTDNLFVTTVCLVMALLFGVNPLLQMKAEGKLPFQKRLSQRTATVKLPGTTTTTPALLDAKGRAVPPDVRSMVANMKQKQP
jgi:hypothetical protein